MKIKIYSQVLTGFARVFGIAGLTSLATSAMNLPSYAEGTTFYCDKSNSVPTTVVRTLDGKNLPIIRWITTSSSKELTPVQRCQQVSRRFQKSYDNGTLRYIKAGILNGLPVVCAAAEKNAACTDRNLLFTLKPGSDPNATARQLFDRRALAAGNATNQFGGDTSNDPVNIDVEAYLYFTSSQPNGGTKYLKM
ncbi:COP23 domain-containing protein [Plectonema radiosum NIES-515]|uniref:COP23 domain-containing protein n=1 Tax=Plectonema radiosum NIES-515 TaxID=2986073 RepID=A0ABT3ASC6_9CYAN|nr:COP23 domain-containing protein [Plectonema radiosum]MCV3212017.1 COP23 domain-containing protein [Plectonema radiosum NIES-515]